MEVSASTNKYPLVSVLMTAYNRERYIAEAITSVQASLYKNFELIIVDDCSSDSTLSIARMYQANDIRIKLFVNDKNLGDYPNRNKAVSLSTGKYIMFCDSDDMYFPDSIGYCVDAMEQFPNAGIGLYYAQPKSAPFLMDQKQAIRNHFFTKPFLGIGPGGSIIRRDFFFDIKGYPEKYGPANDMYFNLKAASNAPLVLLPKLFLHYRIHEGQEQNNLYAYMYNNYRYLADAFVELNLHLTQPELYYLKKKNNRRFAVNLLQYFLRTKSLFLTKNLWKKANFNVKSFINGIFHF